MFLKSGEVRYIIVGLLFTIAFVLLSLGYVWALNILWFFAIVITFDVYAKFMTLKDVPNENHNPVLALFLCVFLGLTSYVAYQNEYPFVSGIIAFTTFCAFSRNLKGLLT